MKRKRGSKSKRTVEAVPDDVLAEGSGPVRRAEVDVVATVEDVVTTDDIATTDDVITPDRVVGTAMDPAPSTIDGTPDEPRDAGTERDDAEARVTTQFDRVDLAGDELASVAAEDAGDAASAPTEDAVEAAGDGDGDAAPPGPGEDAGDVASEGEGDDEAGVVFPTSAASMDAAQLKHLVEALIFASDRPLTVPRLRQLTRVSDVKRLDAALAEIAQDFRERGIVLQQVSGGYQFRTRTQFSAWVQQLIAGRPVRLSRAQLETLAIIAYRQPITRPEIDDIRGVDSSNTLKLLLDRMLIRTLGKREEVGRPTLYGTTKEFLDFFSLGDLRELPTLREYSELTAESRKVMSDRLGISPDEVVPGSGNGGGDDEGGSNGDGGEGSGGVPGGGGIPGGGGDDGFPGDVPASASAEAMADALSAIAPDDELTADEVAPNETAPDEVAPDDELADPAPSSEPSNGLDHAMANFLSTADAVDRSNAAALGELDDELEPPAE